MSRATVSTAGATRLEPNVSNVPQDSMEMPSLLKTAKVHCFPQNIKIPQKILNITVIYQLHQNSSNLLQHD